MPLSSKVTRRSLAGQLAGAIAAAKIGSAQTPPADADLQSARDALKANEALIAKVKLPMATEPACHFKA
jgi:hypothetical protein